MAGPKILVLGATGALGLCILRELLHRNHPTIAYARNPSKIPPDLVDNPLLEIVRGEMDDAEKLDGAMAQTSLVLSALGPSSAGTPPLPPYAGYYSETVLPLMRKHGVRRIFALSTISYRDPQDGFSLLRSLLVFIVWLIAPGGYRSMLGICNVFRDADAAKDIDWTVYRVAMIPGGADEPTWKRDREAREAYAGYVARPGWTVSTKRSTVARWLVDGAESGAPEWVGKMPAIGGGSHRKAA